MAVILRVRTVLSYGSGGPGLHTAYFLPGTVGGSTADATDVVGRVRAMFQSQITAFSNSMFIQVSTDVAAIEATTGMLTGNFSAAAAALVTGTGGASQEITAAMILVRSRTNSVINGRAVRGRWYIGPVAATSTNPLGGVITTLVTSWNASANATIAPAGTTSAPVVWHRPTTLNAGTHAPVTSFSTWDQYAVMRSRRDA